VEVKTISGSQLVLPQLPQVKDLGLSLVDPAKSYRQAGDETSAQAALQIAQRSNLNIQNSNITVSMST